MDIKIFTNGVFIVMQKDFKTGWRVVTDPADPQPKIRMSPEMREAVKLTALDNGRTFNNEILVRLARTLYDDKVEININNKGEM